MSPNLRRTLSIAALVALASVRGQTQAPTVDAIVAAFYPQSLVERAEGTREPGEPFEGIRCFAVFDTEPSGAPRTIIAAYTNGSSAVIRVLRANATGSFDIVAEPQGYDFFGIQCEVTLVDLDHDGRNDVFVKFGVMTNDVSWVFKWDGQQLISLTPVTTNFDSTLATRLFGAAVVDVDNDGVQEIYVVSQYPPPLDGPAKPDLLFRLDGDRYVEERPVVGLWRFERKTSAPETDLRLAPLPKGARGPYTLHIVNGAPEGQRRVTSGQVWLNGQEIVRPNDFGARVAFIDRPVTLGAENELMVRLAGAPGSKMLVILKSEGWDAP